MLGLLITEYELIVSINSVVFCKHWLPAEIVRLFFRTNKRPFMGWGVHFLPRPPGRKTPAPNKGLSVSCSMGYFSEYTTQSCNINFFFCSVVTSQPTSCPHERFRVI